MPRYSFISSAATIPAEAAPSPPPSLASSPSSSFFSTSTPHLSQSDYHSDSDSSPLHTRLLARPRSSSHSNGPHASPSSSFSNYSRSHPPRSYIRILGSSSPHPRRPSAHLPTSPASVPSSVDMNRPYGAASSTSQSTALLDSPIPLPAPQHPATSISSLGTSLSPDLYAATVKASSHAEHHSSFTAARSSARELLPDRDPSHDDSNHLPRSMNGDRHSSHSRINIANLLCDDRKAAPQSSRQQETSEEEDREEVVLREQDVGGHSNKHTSQPHTHVPPSSSTTVAPPRPPPAVAPHHPQQLHSIRETDEDHQRSERHHRQSHHHEHAKLAEPGQWHRETSIHHSSPAYRDQSGRGSGSSNSSSHSYHGHSNGVAADDNDDDHHHHHQSLDPQDPLSPLSTLANASAMSAPARTSSSSSSSTSASHPPPEAPRQQQQQQHTSYASSSSSSSSSRMSSTAGRNAGHASETRHSHPDYSHPYDQGETPQMGRPRSGSAALHQQNYGPYLNDSPPMRPSRLFSSSNPPQPSDGAPSHSYHDARQMHQHAGASSASAQYASSPSSSSSSSIPLPSYPYYKSTFSPSSAAATSSSSSSSLSPSSGSSSWPHHTSQLPRPPYPPPEYTRPQRRVYMRDEGGDVPPPSRPILPPPVSMPPPPPVERRAPRVYGIDAADHIPLPARLPPPAPSAAYNSSSQLYTSRQERHSSTGHSSQSYQGQQHGSYSESYGYSSPSSPAPYPLPKDPRYHHDSGYASRYGSDEMRSSYPISPSMDLDKSSKYHRGHSVSEMSDVRLPTYPGPRQYYSASQPSSRRASEQNPMADGNGDGWPVRHSFSFQSSRSSYPTPPATHSYGSTHGMNGSHDSYASSSQDREAMASPQDDYAQSRAHFYAHSVHPFDTDVPPPPPPAPGSSASLSAAEDGSQGSSSIKDEKRKSSSVSKRTRVTEEKKIVVDNEEFVVKAKRKRANASQLSVLNAAFARSYFPSTEERLRLSKQCKMCPRTVQIWFQNKRQSVKAKSEAMEAAMAVAASRAKEQERQKERLKNGEPELAQTAVTATTAVVPAGTADSAGAEKRRSSDTMTTADAVVEALQIQLDGRGVDYFSRKRRATVAFMTSK